MTSSTTPDTAASGGGTTAPGTSGVPEYMTMIPPAAKRSIAELAAFAVGLLVEDLPQPVYFSVSESGQEISFQFEDSLETFRAMALWAERFGGTVTGCPRTHDDGRQSVHCQVKFITDGVTVEAYAFVTPAKAAPVAT